jgi:hypothetical protein
MWLFWMLTTLSLPEFAPGFSLATYELLLGG